jgi:PilZ domain
MGFKRKHSRVAVGRLGRLQRGSFSAPCKVLDVSDSGVKIESRMFVKVGDTIQLVVELDEGRTLCCTIQLVHVRAPRFGARVTSISPEDQERLSHLLDDRVQHLYSSNRN